MRLALPTVVAAFALSACSALQHPIRVTPSGVYAEPKPKGCALEFLKDRPSRPFEELGELETHLTSPPQGTPAEVLRDDACRLGADAVIVTRAFVTNEFGHMLVAGTAIKWAEPASPPPEAAPEAQPSPAAPEAPPPKRSDGAVNL